MKVYGALWSDAHHDVGVHMSSGLNSHGNIIIKDTWWLPLFFFGIGVLSGVGAVRVIVRRLRAPT
jgi:hypothetical protein